MTLEYRPTADGKGQPVMTACPFCGTKFGDRVGVRRMQHFRNDCEMIP